MATPNTQLSQLALSDVNGELNFAVNAAIALDDQIVRNLTGVQNKTVPRSSILFSDLSDKAAFDGILTPSGNSVADYGQVSAIVPMQVDSDLYSPDVVWTYSIITGSGNIIFQPGVKTANIALVSDVPGVQTVNAQVNAAVYFGGHLVGTDSKYISLQTEVYTPALSVSGTLSVNNQGFVAQTAVTQITATSNVIGGAIRFTTTPNGGSVSGNTITFSSTAGFPGVDNNSVYSLKTDVLYNNVVVESNTVTVSVRAVYLQPDLILTLPVSENNVFANSGPVNSSIRVTATHDVAGANVVWTAEKISGDNASLVIPANNAYANLTLDVAAFGASKAVYDVKASLQYSNGFVLNQKTRRLTLRTVGYGLTFNPASNEAAEGYGAQTAVTSASATYQAGSFSWDIHRDSGATANLTSSVGSTSAATSLSISATVPGTINSTYRINPVIRFDGIVVANVSSTVSLSAQNLPYTFELSGPVVNTQVGDDPVTSSSRTTATHTVADGYVVWSINNGSVTLSSNTSSANLSITTNTINTQVTTLTASLYDEFNRLVTQTNRSITLRAYDPNIRFIGSNSASNTSYSPPVVSTLVVESRADGGANSFSITTQKISGDDMTVTPFSGNTIFDRVTVVAQTSNVGTVSGSYRLTATVNYFGTTFSKTYDVSATAAMLDSGFSLNTSNGDVTEFNFPVTANGTIEASYSVPGATVQWNVLSTSGTPFSTSSNNTHYVLRSRSSSGFNKNTVTQQVAATMLNANGQAIVTLTANVSASATIANPDLQLSGSNNVNTSNVFKSYANTTLTASSNASLIGETYQFSTQKVSGATASISSGPTSVSLSLEANGTQSLSSVYDVTATVVSNGQQLQSITRRVNLSSTALSPTITFASSNATSNGFGFPVTANASITAYSVPTSNVQFTITKVSGSTLQTSNTSNTATVSASQSSVGVLDGTYDVIASFYTPDNSLITTRTARVRAIAERYNPGFVWDYVAGSTVTQKGWEENITAQANVAASVNNSLSGHVFDISGVYVSGANGVYSETGNTATVALSNNRTVNGLSPRTSVWDMTCSVILGGQTIAGPFTRRITARTEPYFITMTPASVSNSATNQAATATVTFSTNHESFGSTPVTWTTLKTAAAPSSATAQFTFANSAGVNNQIIASLTPGFVNGSKEVTYTLTANYVANSATRSANAQITLSTVRDDGGIS